MSVPGSCTPTVNESNLYCQIQASLTLESSVAEIGKTHLAMVLKWGLFVVVTRQSIERQFIERQLIERQFIERQFIERQFIETTVYRNDSSSNRQFIERQFIEPTVYRTTVYRTTAYRTTVYRTDSLSKRQFIEFFKTNYQHFKWAHAMRSSNFIIPIKRDSNAPMQRVYRILLNAKTAC